MATVGVPFQIGGFAGAAAVVAAGGTLAAAIAAMILSGAVTGGLGALLALAVARHHAQGEAAWFCGSARPMKHQRGARSPFCGNAAQSWFMSIRLSVNGVGTGRSNSILFSSPISKRFER